MENQVLKCYMCDNIATSDEHVPPKCLFPEKKDTKGIDFRKNLMTVPSCDIHNSSKSKDDEFLMISLSGVITNNAIGQFHYLTKSTRAIRRKSQDFIDKQVLRNHRTIDIKISDREYKTILIGNPNVERLESCLNHIARGLYYHEFQNTFFGEIRVFFGFLEYSEQKFQTLKKFIKRRFEIEEVLKLIEKGDNPEVFTYEFQKPDDFGLMAAKLTFYGKTEVYISYKTDASKQPYDLAFDLMLKGIKSTFTLGDEKFEFN
jgi:hypothetical protein